jgi:hypothetical protein
VLICLVIDELDCNRVEWSDGGDGRGGARDFVGRDLESVIDRGVYENLTRGRFSTIHCYFDARRSQPDLERVGSRVP